MGSKGYKKVLSTYNKSVKIMYDLPWATHRYPIEPLTGSQHVSRILVRRYMSFIEKIEKSRKSSLKQLLEVSKKDVRQTTGHNLRSIMEITGKNTIEELNRNVDFEYHKAGENVLSAHADGTFLPFPCWFFIRLRLLPLV